MRSELLAVFETNCHNETQSIIKLHKYTVDPRYFDFGYLE